MGLLMGGALGSVTLTPPPLHWTHRCHCSSIFCMLTEPPPIPLNFLHAFELIIHHLFPVLLRSNINLYYVSVAAVE